MPDGTSTGAMRCAPALADRRRLAGRHARLLGRGLQAPGQERDRVMKKLIPQFGEARLQSRGDAFTTLARSHRRPADLGQGRAVGVGPLCGTAGRHPPPAWRRRAQAVPGRSAAARSRAVARKVEYLLDLSRSLRMRRWCTCANGRQMDDEAIIEELVAIRGIGRWTAEMFLIFHLMRPNVLPLDDVGLLKGISQNYFSRRAGAASRGPRSGRRPGRRTARWQLGIFGAASTRCRSTIECGPSYGPSLGNGTNRTCAMSKRHFLDFEQPIAELEAQDRRAALRAERVGRRHLRRDRPAWPRRASS